MTSRNWLSFVQGYTSAPYDGVRSDEIVRGWIEDYKSEAERVIGQMVVDYGIDMGIGLKKRDSDSGGEEDGRILTVLRRWRLVVELCERGLGYLKM
jgi:hypothetical protein